MAEESNSYQIVKALFWLGGLAFIAAVVYFAATSG